jgi:hypothetical protein
MVELRPLEPHGGLLPMPTPELIILCSIGAAVLLCILGSVAVAVTVGEGAAKAPDAGELEPAEPERPHCGPHGQDPELADEPVTAALAAIKMAWAQSANRPHCGPHGGLPRPHCGPHSGLAEKFRRTLQGQPALIGEDIPQLWVEEVYPIFCRAEGVDKPPPYRDFACELGKQMPKRRKDERRRGGDTFTVYVVPDPTVAVAAVIDLDKARKRAKK